MNNNSLSGEMSSVGQLRSVEDLQVSGNNLTGVLPKQLPAKLKQLKASGNQISGTISWDQLGCRPYGNCSLQQLDLSGNRLSGSLAADINSVQSLTKLDISGNSFDGAIPWGSIRKLNQLVSLDLSNNPFRDDTD